MVVFAEYVRLQFYMLYYKVFAIALVGFGIYGNETVLEKIVHIIF